MRKQQALSGHPVPPHWPHIGFLRLWQWPLEHTQSMLDRLLGRMLVAFAGRQVQAVEHWERIATSCDPFILVANHSSRREAVYLPALLLLARQGRPVHFLADWNFRLIPGAGRLYRGTGAITVTRKDAKPRVLNLLKPLFESDVPPLEQARCLLAAGQPIGIFPEGTVNRNAETLLRGRFGAARLSLETGAPVLPLGIRFHGVRARDGVLDTSAPMSLHIGRPMAPPLPATQAPIARVREWHGEIMSALAALSGKRWPPAHPEPAPTDSVDPDPVPQQRILNRGGSRC